MRTYIIIIITIYFLYTVFWDYNIPLNTQDFVFFITTAPRQHSEFYLGNLLLNLKHSGIFEEKIATVATETLFPEYESFMTDNQNINSIFIENTKSEISLSGDPKILSKSRIEQAITDISYRKQWRSKEALDFCKAAEFALNSYPSDNWFIFLEDDMTQSFNNDLISKIENAKQLASTLGVCWLGKRKDWVSKSVLFHREYLQSLVSFVRIYYTMLPIDWLFEEFEDILGRSYNSRPFLPIFDHKGIKRSYLES